MILAASFLLLVSPEDGPDDLRRRIESAPPRVAAFIERRAGCNHFGGEEAYDAARRAEIEAALRELDCRRIGRDEGALRRIYRHRPAVLRLLTETAGLTGG